MTEKTMKNFRKIIAALMALALSVIILASCGNNKEKPVAVYDGNEFIYETDDDFSDFYNLNRYFYAYESGSHASTSSEYNTVLSNAVKQTLMVRILGNESSLHGIAIDMEQVFLEAEKDKAAFESTYNGGFAQFCEDWGVSENVFVRHNTYEAIKEIEKKNAEVEVTDEEILKYYKNNPEKYFKTPHYDVQTIFLQVGDTSDSAEMRTVYNDALIYIQMLNSGRSWESVKQQASFKYNKANGLIFSEHLSMLNHVSMKYFFEVEDLNAALNKISEEFIDNYSLSFKEMFPDIAGKTVGEGNVKNTPLTFDVIFPNGFDAFVKEHKLERETKEYNFVLEAYMNYSQKVYDTEFNYAITNFWENGMTYYKPIYHSGYNSYVVMTFSRIEEENIKIELEDAKEEIIKILEEQKKDKAAENHISKKMAELKVQINYK
jgi:hypothetical protein